MILKNTADALQSYLASILGFMVDVNWMAVGAAILLVARLIQDVPKAIEEIERFSKRRKEKRDGKSN